MKKEQNNIFVIQKKRNVLRFVITKTIVIVLILTAASSLWGLGRSEKQTQSIQSVFTDIGLDTSENPALVNTEVWKTPGDSNPILDESESFRLIFFGATWCPACQKELPTIESLYRTFKDDISILFVYTREEVNHVENFMNENRYSLPYAIDLNGVAADANKIESYPTAYLIDPDGNTVFRIVGLLDWADPKITKALKMAMTIWES